MGRQKLEFKFPEIQTEGVILPRGSEGNVGLDLVLVGPPVPQEERVALCLDKAAWLSPLAPSSSPYSLL